MLSYPAPINGSPAGMCFSNRTVKWNIKTKWSTSLLPLVRLVCDVSSALNQRLRRWFNPDERCRPTTQVITQIVSLNWLTLAAWQPTDCQAKWGERWNIIFDLVLTAPWFRTDISHSLSLQIIKYVIMVTKSLWMVIKFESNYTFVWLQQERNYSMAMRRLPLVY